MKLRILIVAVLTLLAGSLFASDVDSVLTSDSTLWSVSASSSDSGEPTRLELTRRNGDQRSAIVVPTTEDEATESDARLAWDRRSNTLFVMWERAASDVNETRLAALRSDGTWSEPMVIAADGAKRAGLQLVMTTSLHEKAKQDSVAIDTTFLHAVWWNLTAEDAHVEYALLAFDGGTLLSSDLSTLNAAEHEASFAREETGDAVHPPLAMVRSGEGVEIVFGERDSTAVNRVNLQPNKIEANARIWRPGRSIAGTRTPSSKLASLDGKPVQAFTVNGRIVLYSPEEKFRYSVFADGEWTPVRMIKLDENITSEHLVQELHRAVETNAPLEPKPDSE